MIPLGRPKWAFFDHVEGGRNPIADWYDTLSEEAQFQFDALLKSCAKTENHLHWLGFRGFLKGKLKDQRIWELGFHADKRQYRLLGIFGKRSATLLVGCYHKGGNYTPTDVLETAVKRAKGQREGKEGVSVYARQINTDF
jgi:hypothetical protein